MAHLEDAFATFAKSVDKLAKARRAATTDISTQMSSFATSESHAPLSNGFKRLARTEKLLTDIQAAEATTELVTLFDNFSYQSANARVAKVCQIVFCSVETCALRRRHAGDAHGA